MVREPLAIEHAAANIHIKAKHGVYCSQHQKTEAAPAFKEATRKEHRSILSSNNERAFEEKDSGVHIDAALAALPVKPHGYHDDTDGSAGLGNVTCYTCDAQETV